MKPLSAKFFACHFQLGGAGGGCGLASLNSILTMLDKRGIIFAFSPEKGISPKRIIRELRLAGLSATPKLISIRNLKRHSILWYPPPRDHYVVVREVKDGKALVYDSEKSRPYWLPLPSLQKKWYKQYSGRMCGWVIEVRKK